MEINSNVAVTLTPSFPALWRSKVMSITRWSPKEARVCVCTGVCGSGSVNVCDWL